MGLVAGKIIKAQLFNPTSVALALIVGGVALILVERKAPGKVTSRVEEITLCHSPTRWLLSDPGSLARLFTFWQHDHRRIALRALTHCGGGVFFFDRRAHDDDGYRTRTLGSERNTLYRWNLLLLLFGSGIAFVVALLAIKGFEYSSGSVDCLEFIELSWE